MVDPVRFDLLGGLRYLSGILVLLHGVLIFVSWNKCDIAIFINSFFGLSIWT